MDSIKTVIITSSLSTSISIFSSKNTVPTLFLSTTATFSNYKIFFTRFVLETPWTHDLFKTPIENQWSRVFLKLNPKANITLEAVLNSQTPKRIDERSLAVKRFHWLAKTRFMFLEFRKIKGQCFPNEVNERRLPRNECFEGMN